MILVCRELKNNQELEINLKGMAWDHPRRFESLRAFSSDFMELHPMLSIEWDVPNLKEFGDMPIEDLIEEYDLITLTTAIEPTRQ